MMMQIQETPNPKNSLFNAMSRFIGAVNNMDQTVMVPSLLMDVPLDEDRGLGSLKSDMEDGDMYSYYQLLKSIRQDIEWGVRCAAADEKRKESMTLTRSSSSASTTSSASSVASFSSEEDEEEEEEDEDLHEQFQYHLTGLQGVLSKLTQSAVSLTKRYNKEIGVGCQ
ncbi:mid1-interacting protein 1-B-like [Eucyclogobius newberryi]|uniref:mid1-interacting protein 1-B-like n=1 Tax=Eucyclogobius newberryi TaxID=166745 RepID=UPI003B59B1FC